MDNNNAARKLIRTKWGFYQYDPLPSDEELSTYYEKKYYQEGRGSYDVSYTDEETQYFQLKAQLIHQETTKLVGDTRGKRLVDIGCGEGWVMQEFHDCGCSLQGLDFSRHGMEKFHPHLLPFLDQGDLYSLMQDKVKNEEPFDFLICANVIEHVKDPVGLLQTIKSLMHPQSLLVIVAPNDFSPLHEYLLKNDKISRQFWLCYPDHLSYFNKDSMTTLLSDLDFDMRAIVADNPIDLNLLNDNSNYINDASKGKSTHLFRILTDNFLGSIDRDGLLKIYEILGSMGVGRDLDFYCTLK